MFLQTNANFFLTSFPGVRRVAINETDPISVSKCYAA